MIKKIGIGAAVVAVAGLLAACSSSDDNTTSAAPSPSASDTGIDGTGATLTVWVDENRQPAVQAAAATFEQETGAKVELVVKNFEDIRSDFIAQVPTGEGPDITIGAHDWLGALVTAGVEMDVLGIAYHDFSHEHRDHVCAHHPREANFKEGIIEHFANGIIRKPGTTFGNVKADVLALKDPDHFVRGNFCSIILGSAWPI